MRLAVVSDVVDKVNTKLKVSAGLTFAYLPCAQASPMRREDRHSFAGAFGFVTGIFLISTADAVKEKRYMSAAIKGSLTLTGAYLTWFCS
ncbi:MAG: hypothetical protein QF486_06420 [Candidatus Woesearchaeota archaeon]|jgi:hypothetical protein|nr:hypothetical protein [Candidatus Woesearchaeota archaeon]MDP7199221.1 hypothetical protein [Candidatus Woesearchaeota archaeon]MDP7467834.1 hypothetical protein [Candidatus Woesearchaeota archaeon]MDP7647824.1 hypothetical protein [Candidatus Woesearchaeota archaeon]|tara:strand:- start:638 stop:907 length:270 start_codon:yes stop_codon:yes gene_type:complete